MNLKFSRPVVKTYKISNFMKSVQ